MQSLRIKSVPAFWRRRVGSLAIVVAVVCPCGSALAEGDTAWRFAGQMELRRSFANERTSSPAWTGRSPSSLREHLVHRLEGQFEDFAGYRMTPAPAAREVDEYTHRMLIETAGDRARRGSRRALEDYLRAATPVGPFIERLEAMNPLNRLGNIDPLRGLGERGRSERASRKPAIDIGIGFNHLTPGLELERKIGEGSIRTMIDVLGWFELEYEQGGGSRTRFHLGYDALRGEAIAGCRFAF